MRILHRHVLAETAFASLVATGAFVFLMVTSNVLNQVAGAMTSGRISGEDGLMLVALLFPGVIPYALPLGVLTGVLMAFGRMSSQHELTAMKAAGLGLPAIARPVLVFAGALALLSAWLNLEVAPACNTEFRRLLVGSARENPAAIIAPGELNRQFKGVLIRAGRRDGDVLGDFWLWRVDSQGRLTQTVHAEEARIVRAENKAGEAILRVNLRNARMQTRAAGDDGFARPVDDATVVAASLEIPAGGMFQTGGIFERKLRWLTTAELLTAMESGWKLPPDAKPAEVTRSRMLAATQFNAHLAGALCVFSLTLLAVPLAVRVGRAETFVNATLAVAVALGYYLLTEMVRYVKDPAWRPDLLVWVPNLIVLAVGVVLLRRAARN